MLFGSFFEELQKRKIRYLVIGGVAVNFHGFSRTTGDLDILISLDEKNVLKFIDFVKVLKLKTRVPVNIEAFADVHQRTTWIKEKHMKVFSVYNPKNEMEHIDVMIENYIDFEKAYQKKQIVHMGSLKIPIMGIPDLIQLKKIAGRERDKIDIRALQTIMELKYEKEKRDAD